MNMSSSNTSVIKSLKVVEEEVAAPPTTPPPLPPTKKSVGGGGKQGIIAILGSDSERSKAAGSIRRTLSADMSSKKWLSQNGFASPPAMKKTASSDELAAAPEEEEEEEEDEEDEIKRRSLDVWSSILQSHRTVDSSSQLPPSYVHPLVKKSANSLTGKSLEICTESLGSETGSDCFSSYPSSESGDSADEEKDDHQSPPEHELIFPPFPEEFPAVKHSYSKKSPPRSFPPPLPSLVRGDDKPAVRMHSRRHHGRLILEAVSVPAQNCFRAERQDGRLILTFANNPPQEETEGWDADKVLDEMPDSEDNNLTIDGYDEEEEETENEMEIMIGKSSKLLINVNSLITLNNNKNKLNRPAFVEEIEDDQTTPLQLFQAAAAAAPTAASFNPYDFFWKKKPTTIATLVHIPSITDQQYRNKVVTKCPKTSACEGKDHSLVLITGRHHSNNNKLILPMKNRGCKEPRMSLLFWDSYCIATS
ncbi:PREDICTED: protein FAF-like, chloroplastic [Ipomoea nil]|uniref:protein FAF-like, chloroplastic n=1 Tax=Ipomoea nil TaxID=35883 RepID=UPI0009017366|nr:PREDICTED: protein FAF-like, chloroplastic [Ipomoea nil]